MQSTIEEQVETPIIPSGSKSVVEIRPYKGLFDLELTAVWQYRELMYFLIWRELKVRYKQAAIGAGWAIIQPIFMVVVFSIIFGNFAKIPSDGVPYPLFAFTAVLPWAYFAESLRRGSTCLVDDSDLIRKIYFPRLILPLTAVTVPLVDFALAFLVLIALFLWYGAVPSWNMVFLPIFLLMPLTLALALGLWLGPINVRFRDIKHTIPLVIQLWMFASPVVYPLSLIPEQWRLLYSLNPMVGVIEGFRWALLRRENPDFLAMGLSALIVVVILVGGVIYFKKMEKSFADLI